MTLADVPIYLGFIDSRRGPTLVRSSKYGVEVTSAFNLAIRDDDAWIAELPNEVSKAFQMNLMRAYWGKANPSSEVSPAT